MNPHSRESSTNDRLNVYDSSRNSIYYSQEIYGATLRDSSSSPLPEYLSSEEYREPDDTYGVLYTGTEIDADQSFIYTRADSEPVAEYNEGVSNEGVDDEEGEYWELTSRLTGASVYQSKAQTVFSINNENSDDEKTKLLKPVQPVIRDEIYYSILSNEFEPESQSTKHPCDQTKSEETTNSYSFDKIHLTIDKIHARTSGSSYASRTTGSSYASRTTGSSCESRTTVSSCEGQLAVSPQTQNANHFECNNFEENKGLCPLPNIEETQTKYIEPGQLKATVSTSNRTDRISTIQSDPPLIMRPMPPRPDRVLMDDQSDDNDECRGTNTVLYEDLLADQISKQNLNSSTEPSLNSKKESNGNLTTCCSHKPMEALCDKLWFDSNISKEDAEHQCRTQKIDGSFIVRNSQEKDGKNLSITFYSDKVVNNLRHFRLTFIAQTNQWRLGTCEREGEQRFNTVSECVEFCISQGITIEDGTRIKLTKPLQVNKTNLTSL